MNKLTAKEIIAELEKQAISVEDFAYCDIPNPLPNIGSWREVHQEGGSDQGSHWESVKYFKDHDVYIKTIGHYTSYYGTDFDYGYGEEVKPIEKTITVYE